MPAHRVPAHLRKDTAPSHQAPALVLAASAPANPGAPDKLRPEAVVIWDRFFESEVAKALNIDSDIGSLHRWIRAWDEWFTVSEVFGRERVVEGSQGQPVLNPLAQRLATLEKTISDIERDFGMRPLARMRLGLVGSLAKKTAHELNAALDRAAQGGEGLGLVEDEIADEFEEA